MQVIEALAQAGLESSNLIIGIDLTKSNEWTGSLCELICKERKHLFLDLDTWLFSFAGKNSFNGMSLYHIGDTPNPYEQAISIIGQTLSAFDEDNLIPCYGFGDGNMLLLLLGYRGIMSNSSGLKMQHLHMTKMYLPFILMKDHAMVFRKL